MLGKILLMKILVVLKHRSVIKDDDFYTKISTVTKTPVEEVKRLISVIVQEVKSEPICVDDVIKESENISSDEALIEIADYFSSTHFHKWFTKRSMVLTSGTYGRYGTLA